MAANAFEKMARGQRVKLPPKKKQRSVDPKKNPKAKGPPAPAPKRLKPKQAPRNVGAQGALGPKAPKPKPVKRAKGKVGAQGQLAPKNFKAKKGVPRLPIATANPQGAIGALTKKGVPVKQPKLKGGSGLGFVKVIEQIERPLFGVTAGIDAATSGKNPLPAIGKGLALKKKVYGSDLAKKAGVKNKVLQTVLGLPLDYGLDPATYVSLAGAPMTGGGSVAGLVAAKTAAKEAAKEAVEQAAKATTKQAAKAAKANVKVAKKQVKKTTRAHSEATTRGVSVGLKAKVPFTHVGGRVGTSGKLTRKVAAKSKPTRERIRGNPTVSRVGRETIHDFREAGTTTAAHRDYKAIGTKGRGRIHTADHKTFQEGRALKKAIKQQAKREGITKEAAALKIFKELQSDHPVSAVAKALAGTYKDLGEARKILGIADPYKKGALLKDDVAGLGEAIEQDIRHGARTTKSATAKAKYTEGQVKALTPVGTSREKQLRKQSQRAGNAARLEREAKAAKEVADAKKPGPKTPKVAQRLERKTVQAAKQASIQANKAAAREAGAGRSLARLPEDAKVDLDVAAKKAGKPSPLDAQGNRTLAAKESAERAGQAAQQATAQAKGATRASERLTAPRRKSVAKQQREADRRYKMTERKRLKEEAKLKILSGQSATGTRYYKNKVDRNRAAQEELTLKKARHEHSKKLKELEVGDDPIAYTKRIIDTTDPSSKAHQMAKKIYERQITDADAYAPMVTTAHLKPEGKQNPFRKAKRNAEKPQQRKLRKPIDEQLKDGVDQSLDLPEVHALRTGKSRRDVALASFWNEARGAMIAHGDAKQVLKGMSEKVDIKPGHKLYEVTPRGLTAVANSEDVAAAFRTAGSTKRRFVVAREQHVDNFIDAIESNIPVRTKWGEGYDAVLSRWKWLATVPRPGFHVRNEISDLYNSMVIGGTTAKDHLAAIGVLRSKGRDAVRASSSKRFTKGQVDINKKIKVGDRTLTHRQLIDEAEANGAIGGGFFSAELGQRFGREGRLARLSQAREDRVRLGTYIGALREGKTPLEAATQANKLHFDYGDLASAERALRRGISPFWTWAARNMRLQVETLATKPGVIANTMITLDEIARAVGYDDYSEFLQEVPDYLRRQLPVPAKGKTDIFPQLPAASLAQVAANPFEPGKFANRQKEFGLSLVGPIKTGTDLLYNKKIDTDQDLQGKFGERQLVPAPFGIGEKMIDKKSGKKITGWDSRIEHATRLFPEASLFKTAGGVDPTSQRSKGQFLFGEATGLRPTPHSKKQAQLTEFGAAKRAIDKKISKLNQKRASGSEYETRKTREQIKLEKERDRLQGEIDKRLPKKKSSGGGSGRGAFSGGGFKGGGFSGGGFQ